MQNIFSKLGEIAQNSMGAVNQATGNAGTNAASNGGTDFMSALKSSVPGGMGGLLGAGALGGILGAVLSNKKTKDIGQGVLMAGGTAAAAALAWKVYQKWSDKGTQGAPQQASSSPQNMAQYGQNTPSPEQQNSRGIATQGYVPALTRDPDPTALLVLEAMIFAARADGFVDDKEQAAVHQMMEQLFPGTDVAQALDGLLRCPLDPEGLARKVPNAEEGRDIYRISRMVIEVDHSMEQAYLTALARALGISAQEQLGLDEEVRGLLAQALPA